MVRWAFLASASFVAFCLLSVQVWWFPSFLWCSRELWSRRIKCFCLSIKSLIYYLISSSSLYPKLSTNWLAMFKGHGFSKIKYCSLKDCIIFFNIKSKKDYNLLADCCNLSYSSILRCNFNTDQKLGKRHRDGESTDSDGGQLSIRFEWLYQISLYFS